MQKVTEAEIVAAGGFANVWLYRMCKDSPSHDNPQIVSSKMQLIGRFYSASLSRGMGELEAHNENRPKASFYDELAAQMCRNSEELDRELKAVEQLHFSADVLDSILSVHALFEREIVKFSEDWRKRLDEEIKAKPEKRKSGNVHWKVTSRASFVSKYLHFHAPDTFPLLDSFAKDGLTTKLKKGNCLSKRQRAPKGSKNCPLWTPYGRFCRMMLELREMPEWKEKSLRKIDADLLGYWPLEWDQRPVLP